MRAYRSVVAFTACFFSCAHYLEESRPSGSVEFDRVDRGTGVEEHFGEGACSVGDWDGDGFGDYACEAGATVRTSSGEMSVRTIRIVSGASGKVLLGLEPSSGSLGFGPGLCGLPDIDGDGRRDLAVVALGNLDAFTGLDSESVPSRIELRSSRDGRVIRSLSAEGDALACLEDPKDPESSVLVAACDEKAPKGGVGFYVLAIRCRDGAIAYRFGDSGSEQIVPDVARCGDIDGDGFPEFAVAGFDRRLRVVSGRSGRLVRTVELALRGRPVPTDDSFDLDGDGIPDFAAAEFVSDPMESDGRIEVFSGRDGRRLWSAKCLAASAASLRIGDRTVLAAAGPGTLQLFVPPATDATSALALDSKGFARVASLDDVDGDGRPDLAVADEGGAGCVGILSSRTIERAIRR